MYPIVTMHLLEGGEINVRPDDVRRFWPLEDGGSRVLMYDGEEFQVKESPSMLGKTFAQCIEWKEGRPVAVGLALEAAARQPRVNGGGVGIDPRSIRTPGA